MGYIRLQTQTHKIGRDVSALLLVFKIIYLKPSIILPLAHPALGIWVKCRDDSCTLTMLYMIHGRSYEVSFDNIGPLYDEAWHKLAVHVTGIKRGVSSYVSVYVDCALQGKKAISSDYHVLVPFVNKKPTSSQIWLAQRSRGYRGGFERPWRVCLVKMCIHRTISLGLF